MKTFCAWTVVAHVRRYLFLVFKSSALRSASLTIWNARSAASRKTSFTCCEVLVVLDDIIPMLTDSGINPAGITLEGLHPMSRFPEHTHPHCKCFCEPLIPTRDMLKPPYDDVTGTTPDTNTAGSGAAMRDATEEGLNRLSTRLSASELAKVPNQKPRNNRLALPKRLPTIQEMVRSIGERPSSLPIAASLSKISSSIHPRLLAQALKKICVRRS